MILLVYAVFFLDEGVQLQTGIHLPTPLVICNVSDNQEMYSKAIKNSRML